VVTIKLARGETVEIEFERAEEIFEVSCGSMDEVSIVQTSGWLLDPTDDDAFLEKKLYPNGL
jgi:hypothetical protein